MNSDEGDDDDDDDNGEFNIVGKQSLQNCAAGPVSRESQSKEKGHLQEIQKTDKLRGD